MKSLLREGADAGNNELSSLMLASIEGNVDESKLVLENGAKVDLRRSLMVACQKGHVDVAKMLLENGATIDLQAEDGFIIRRW